MAPLATAVNSQLKAKDIIKGVSIPATQYYIKEYLPVIICQVINRINLIGKKVDEKSIFNLDSIDPNIMENV